MVRTTRAIEARRLKFTPALLANIRHRFEHTDESLSTMAADLGCCKTTLHGIAKRGGWVRYVRPPRDLASSARLEARAEALADDRQPEEAGEGRSDSLRHPEVRAQRASKDGRPNSVRPWPSPFEGRLRRPPQGDGYFAGRPKFQHKTQPFQRVAAVSAGGARCRNPDRGGTIRS